MDALRGTYSLETAAGAPLPYSIGGSPSRSELLGATLTLTPQTAAKGACTYRVDFRDTSNGVVTAQGTDTMSCTYVYGPFHAMIFSFPSGTRGHFVQIFDDDMLRSDIYGRTITVRDRNNVEFVFRR